MRIERDTAKLLRAALAEIERDQRDRQVRIDGLRAELERMRLRIEEWHPNSPKSSS